MDTKNQEKLYDFVVIGSGIVGANIVRELAKYSLSILLLEKESDVVNGQTLANSGIIHSGHDPLEGTLKAQLCVEGNALAHKLSKELDFHLLECGGLVLAFSKEEEVISNKQKEYEYLMLNLRLAKGFCLKDYKKKFNDDFNLKYKKPIKKLIERKLALIEKERFFFTYEGMFLFNYSFNILLD